VWHSEMLRSFAEAYYTSSKDFPGVLMLCSARTTFL
jgi:hypothetical protein